MARDYEAVFARSLADPRAFWAKAAEDIVWYKRWEKVLDSTRAPLYTWFSGGEVNTCYNALDRHVEDGRGYQTALIYDSPVTDTIKTFTYLHLRDLVALAAGMLANHGVVKGDRVLIYMPMIPEAVIAMLACARLGAVHTVVFGGFAANELANRIDDAEPKVILSASCGIEVKRLIDYKPLLDNALAIARHQPKHCIIVQREIGPVELTPGRDVDWAEALAAARPAECVPVAATDPLYILYTSGTTGAPKGIVRDNGGHMVALKWSMPNVYNMKPGEVFWAASDVGWVVGHSYIVYGPLLHGCGTVLFEGKPVGTPDPGAFWRVIARHRVVVLYTAPTAFRAIRRDDPEAAYIAGHDMSCFRTLFLGGERCDPSTLEWAQTALGVPIIDNWWQTETGWPMATNCLGLGKFPVKLGSPGKVVPGYSIRVVDDEGRDLPHGEIGNIVVDLPLPPGCLPTLWRNDERYERSYLREFPGAYQTGDAGSKDPDGYLWIMSRTDDILNVAGHRLSTGGMEEVLAAHPDVAECAVIGVADSLKGQVPLGFLVLKAGVQRANGDIVAEAIQLVRDCIGPVASFKTAAVVERLPKTRSGKILRGTMRKIADAVDYPVPATIEDPGVLDEITQALREIGYAKSS